MFNDQVFNWTPTYSTPSITPWAYSVSFGGFTLHDGTEIKITNLDYLKGKAKEVQKESFWNDGEIFNKRETIQSIKLTWSIKKSSRWVLLAYLDEFKAAIAKDNQYLIVSEWSWSRRVKCTCVDNNFNEKRYNIDWMNFDITFQTYKYWEESAIQEVNQSWITDASFSTWIARDGTAESRMLAILAFTSASWVTQITFWIGTESITINATINAGDNIVIDWENMQVLKGGSRIGFIGEIPKLKESTNQLTITHTWTAQYDLSTQYHVTYK